MNKNEFEIFLTKNGYHAAIEDGTVMITLDHIPSENEMREMLKLKESAGYHSSFGWKTKRPNQN